MSPINAKEMKAIANEVYDWYIETRAWLIQELTQDGYPYGSEPVADDDLVEQFFALSDQDLQGMRMQMMVTFGPQEGMEMFDRYTKSVQAAAQRLGRRIEREGVMVT